MIFATEILIQIGPRGRMPTQAYPGDVGWDLYAAEDVSIAPGGAANVACDISVALPEGWWLEIRGRSSTWRTRGLLTIDGVIDAGYRGPLFVGLINPPQATSSVTIEAGERVGQMILHRVEPCHFRAVSELPPSARGANGFGSSGL